MRWVIRLVIAAYLIMGLKLTDGILDFLAYCLFGVIQLFFMFLLWGFISIVFRR